MSALCAFSRFSLYFQGHSQKHVKICEKMVLIARGRFKKVQTEYFRVKRPPVGRAPSTRRGGGEKLVPSLENPDRNIFSPGYLGNFAGISQNRSWGCSKSWCTDLNNVLPSGPNSLSIFFIPPKMYAVKCKLFCEYLRYAVTNFKL